MPVPPACQAAFDKALATPTYRSDGDRWKVYVNSDLLAIFGSDEALPATEVVPRFSERMRARFPKSQWTGTTILARHWAGAANLLHWALAYGLVTQETATDGSPAWRLVRRDQTYIVDEKRGWSVRQVRGLEPRLQAAQDRAEATRRRLNETLDRKARDAADAPIRRLVQDLVRLDPDIRVEAQSLKAKTPEICHGTRLAECASIVMDAHQRLGMGRPALKAWVGHIDHLVFVAQVRGRGTGRRPDPVTPAPAEIPAEDEAALAGLL